MQYYKLLENRVLEHRYRYYVLDDSVISDFEYDFLEKAYIQACNENGVESILVDSGVGWDASHPEYLAAEQRVLTKQDSYSLWEKEMRDVWNRIGYPKYKVEENDV